MTLSGLLILQLVHILEQHLPLSLETRYALQDELELLLKRAQRILAQLQLAWLIFNDRERFLHDLHRCHVLKLLALRRPARLLDHDILLGLLLLLGFNKLRHASLLLVEMRIIYLKRLARARARDLVEQRLEFVLAA